MMVAILSSRMGRRGLMNSVLWMKGAIAGILLVASPALAQEAAAPADEEHAADEAHEEGGVPHYPLILPERLSWSFAGPFGTYDAEQLQRGLQVYREVCSFCHGMSSVAFRTLASESGPFLSEEAMREVAASFRVRDPDTGETRPGGPPDHFPPSNIPTAPDLSLMAKARGVGDGFPWWLIDGLTQYQEAGPNYIYGLLTGYEPAPAGTELPAGTYYNPHFVSGVAIAMAPPLTDGRVRYADGSPETVDQYARDVSAFLMWTAEPTLGDRKRLGFQVMIFLLAFATLVYLSKRQVWKNVKH